MTETLSRRPRWKPANTGKVIAYTDRVYSILYGLYKYGLLNSEHIRKLYHGNERNTQRRLRELFDHGFVKKFNVKVDQYAPGSEKDVYALTDKGANLLSDIYGVPRLGVRYNENNKRRTLSTIPHALMVSDIVVRFEVACANTQAGTGEGGRPPTEFISQREILEAAPERTQENKNPLHWSVDIRGHDKPVGNNPDHLFGIRDTGRPEGKNEAFFFVEADRGTESVIPKRNDFTKSTPFKKLHAYVWTLHHKLHTKYFGVPNFRVLWVTKSTGEDKDGKTRLENMMAAAREITGGAKPLVEKFLFAEYPSLSEGDPLTMGWKDMHGKDRRIIS